MAHPEQHSILALPVVCLETANHELTLGDVVKGRSTVIDFWTTRCTRCPEALDELNAVAAAQPSHCHHASSVAPTAQFISICCDSLDGAREILDRPRSNRRRWDAMHHYYMAPDDKELAKLWLGFAQVPFYVVVDAHGVIVHTGATVDYTLVPGIETACPTDSNVAATVQTPTKSTVTFAVDAFETKDEQLPIASPNHVFMINDLDF